MQRVLCADDNVVMTTVLGIDIGGTGIKGAPGRHPSGQLLADRHRILTPHPATPDAVTEVVGELAKFFDWTGPTGATFPAVVKDGVARTAANVDPAWIGTDAAALFSKAIGGDVTVVNDADAAGVAEMTFGAGKGAAGVVIMITLGTGIGSALFIDGELVPNTELGHLEDGQARRRAPRRRQRARARTACRGRSGPSGVEEYFVHGRGAVLARPVHHRRRREQEGREVPPPSHRGADRDRARAAAQRGRHRRRRARPRQRAGVPHTD